MAKILRFVLFLAALVFVSRGQGAQMGVYGLIKTDGALIYRTPDFDGDVLGNLGVRTRVVMSRVTYGQMAKFFKIRVMVSGKPIVGYVADIDVVPESVVKNASESPPAAAAPTDTGAKTKVAKRGADGKPIKEKKHKHSLRLRNEHQPILLTHYLGLTGGVTDFKEKITGVNAEQNLLVYGLKITAPDLVIRGPVMELNFLLHYGAPNYYKALSDAPPSGFVLWTDTMLLLPFMHHNDFMIYGSLGPMLVISDFKTTATGHSADLFTINFGGAFALGTGVRIGQVAFRLEGRMNVEVRTYTSYLGAIQIPY